MGEIIHALFYAVRLDAGDFFTWGGLAINENALVCDEQREAIAGL
ncbi:MAG: FAD-binding protein [Pseudomonadales bacterium]|nr:FAD-binding protein [Pseudomonadales bacterium]